MYKMKYVIKGDITRLEINDITIFRYLTKEMNPTELPTEAFNLEDTTLSNSEKNAYKLIYLRRRLNLTMHDVAAMANTSKQMIYFMETFRNNTPDHVIKILEAELI